MKSNGINRVFLNYRASKGDLDAAHSLGVYYYGFCTPSSIPGALLNLSVSIDKYSWDNYYIGAIFQRRNELDKAINSFQSSIDCPLTLYRLATMYAKSTDYYDKRTTVDLLKKLERLKSILSNRNHDEGIIDKEWLLEAANTPDPYATFLVGKWFAEGILFEQSYPEALYYLQKSSELGHANASAYLSDMYFDGLGTNVSKEKSLEYLSKAAQSDLWYMNRLGDRYMLAYIEAKNKKSHSVDLEKVIDAYSKASAVPDASFKLGLIYLSENDVIDEKLAYKKMLDAVGAGHPNAVMELYHMLSNGIGVEKSPQVADEILRSIPDDHDTLCYERRGLNNNGHGYVYERCPGITNDSDGRYNINWNALISYLHVYSDPTFVFRGEIFD